MLAQGVPTTRKFIIVGVIKNKKPTDGKMISARWGFCEVASMIYFPGPYNKNVADSGRTTPGNNNQR